MTRAIHDASARRHSGGPSPVSGPCAVVTVLASVEAEIAGLLDRSTQELRLAWRQMHRTEPPLGLSRDLLIRALAYDLQARAHGGASAAPRRRLQRLAAASAKGALAVDPGVVLKAGTTLVRQWGGHTHTVLVHKDEFEHEGQRYRIIDGYRRTDYRGALVRPAVLWPDQASVHRAPRGDRSMKRSATNSTHRKGTVCCAIYTRKSSEEGLEQEFNIFVYVSANNPGYPRSTRANRSSSMLSKGERVRKRRWSA